MLLPIEAGSFLGTLKLFKFSANFSYKSENSLLFENAFYGSLTFY